MQVSISFGRNEINREINEGATLGTVVTSAVLSVLGAPTENTRFTVGGTEVGSGYVLEDGDAVYIETKAHCKA